MNTALASSTISVLGMAMNGNTPVINNKAVEPEPEPVVDITTPFYIENTTNENGTITIGEYASAYPMTVQTSYDKINWESVSVSGDTTIQIQANSKLYLRCDTQFWGYCDEEERDEGYHYINCNKTHKVGGNIFSLLYGSSFTNQTNFRQNDNYAAAFRNLFNNDVNLTDAGDLLLPATTLNFYCYYQMFKGASNLSRVKCLATNRTGRYCTDGWLSGVSATGTFVKAAGVTWPTGSSGIPSGWTVEEATE